MKLTAYQTGENSAVWKGIKLEVHNRYFAITLNKIKCVEHILYFNFLDIWINSSVWSFNTTVLNINFSSWNPNNKYS